MEIWISVHNHSVSCPSGGIRLWIYRSGKKDTFFTHAHAKTLLQATVLALVPVVLVYLTLSVWPENANKKLWDHLWLISYYGTNFWLWVLDIIILYSCNNSPIHCSCQAACCVFTSISGFLVSIHRLQVSTVWYWHFLYMSLMNMN